MQTATLQGQNTKNSFIQSYVISREQRCVKSFHHRFQREEEGNARHIKRTKLYSRRIINFNPKDKTAIISNNNTNKLLFLFFEMLEECLCFA